MESTPSQDGRTMALVAYASLLTGLPLFLIPLVQRNDAFALRHAKHAGVAYAGGFVLGLAFAIVVPIISIVTCGVGSFLYCLFPVLFLPVVSGIHGVMLALEGKSDPPILTFGLGDSVLSSIQIDPPKDGA